MLPTTAARAAAALAAALLALTACVPTGPPAGAPEQRDEQVGAGDRPAAPPAAPAPAGDAAPQGPGDPAAVLWTGDAETGDLSQFRDTPWNTAFATAPQVVDGDGVREGEHALQFTIDGTEGAGSGICCGDRTELEPAFREVRPGDDLYYGFSTYLAPGFPTDTLWQVLLQWKQIDGSPPLSLNVEQGQYQLQGGASYPGGARHYIQPIAPAEPGVWVDWVLHVRSSPDPAEGFVEVWQDDRLVLPEFHPRSGTLYPGSQGAYLKTGYYRHRDISEPGTLYMDGWRIGTSKAAVSRSGR